MSRFAPETERLLRSGGWTQGRRDAAFAEQCSNMLDRPAGFAMHPAARAAIEEFGGLTFGTVGPGTDFAASDIVFDPRLATGEEDRLHEYFDELRGRNAYPLGECHHGHAFLAVGPDGRGYQVGDGVHLIAESVDELLDAVLLGRSPRRVTG